VNKQYGLGNSKYVVKLDLLPTGHVTQSMRSELLAFNMGKCNFMTYIYVTVQDRHMVSMEHQ